MNTFFQRLLHLLRWSRHAADLREEIEAHRALRQDAFERDGLAPEDAARASRRALGSVALAVEDVRDVWAIRTVDSLWQDVRIALRGLRKSPGFALVAIGTLALGIGANTALFSIFSSLILRPLPVRDPGSLALLTNGSWSYPIWEEIRALEAELFDGAFAWSPQRFDLSASGQSDPVDGAYISGRLFDVLGVPAIRGRMITPADDGGAAPDGPVAVISHRLWRQRFAGVSDVVGRQLTVQRVPFTIVGVMPPGFFGPDVGRMTDVMLPFAADPLIRGKESQLTSRGSWWLQIVVRLKPGHAIEEANAALRARQPQITEGASRNIEPLTLAPAATGNSPLRTRFETPLFAMVVAVGLVLLVACANIASLLLARALSRRRELSVRLALGSSRWRIARLLLIESLIVAVTGAAFGLVFASWSSALLVQQLSTWQRTVSLDLGLDWRVLLFTAALACLSAITAGVAPVLGLKSVGAGEALKDAGRGMAGDRRFVVRSTLVVAQIAVSLVLVVAAGLFLRTFASLNQLPLGFVPEPLLVVELNLQASGGPPVERGARVERLRDAAAAVPGVRSAAVSSTRLLTGGGWATGIVGIGDGPMVRLRAVGRPALWLNATTPGWFETMGTPLRSGRDFTAADRMGTRPLAIVNEAFVRQFLSGEQPLGQTVRGLDAGIRYEIVGVVGDAVYTTPREGMLATMYVPVAQRAPENFWPTVLLTINAAPGRRAAVQRDVAEALTRVDPTIAFTFGTFDQLVEATVTQERLIAMLAAFFGGLALLLAAVGLYGVVSHAVRARQAELGLRLALGATSSSIVRLVFQRVGILIAAGLALGLAGSLWAARFVEGLLFHLEARDPLTFAGATAVLVAVGVLAAWMPAHRAARLDPVTVLREG